MLADSARDGEHKAADGEVWREPLALDELEGLILESLERHPRRIALVANNKLLGIVVVIYNFSEGVSDD
jgi:hypothetical protein